MQTSHKQTHSLAHARNRTRAFRILFLVSALVAALLVPGRQVKPAKAHPAPMPQSFTFLQAGFTQEIVGVSNFFLGGVAFAPDGDPLVGACCPNNPLLRFDLGSASTINSTPVHPSTVLSDTFGIGITNNPDGNVYVNTVQGVKRLNADTGAQIGPALTSQHGFCIVLGITTDPQTGNLVYVGDGPFVNPTCPTQPIFFADPTFTTFGIFANVFPPAGDDFDGLVFDPTGEFLFLADAGLSPGITIVKRDGTFTRFIPNANGPDGMAFHATTPKFVVSNDNNGTITRYDFPNDDYTQPPALSTFASGGFRGDLTAVGPDGCFYVTQDHTRYNDGTVTNENSLVRICGGFAPPPGVDPPPDITDQKAGSILVYNLYSSNGASPITQNTRLNITNTNSTASAFVHLFFVDGSNCSPADSFICLTPNQTMSFLASDIDPGVTGYMVAVAVDGKTGCPVSFNYLIGDEYVKLNSGHAANLGAEALAAGFPNGTLLPGCAQGSTTATLAFDGIRYSRVPRVLAVDNLPSMVDGNNTLLVLNTIGGGGDLITRAAPASGSDNDQVFGVMYDDMEKLASFNFAVQCQLRQSLSNSFPRTVPPFQTLIPSGRSGWLRLWKVNDVGMLGAAINFNPGAGASSFNQGHNLHKLTLAGRQTLAVPVFPPGC